MRITFKNVILYEAIILNIGHTPILFALQIMEVLERVQPVTFQFIFIRPICV